MSDEGAHVVREALLRHTSQLAEGELRRVRELLDEAFEGDFGVDVRVGAARRRGAARPHRRTAPVRLARRRRPLGGAGRLPGACPAAAVPGQLPVMLGAPVSMWPV
ncbi:hypothetical protein [Streptomyces sp. H34-S4]|uniref:hypothetical protein n=1 Tax=Streptomyces sp. H34-S4 TaxID=2996463 RepID=UPI00226D4569|nr:hypothetical protein [Streptomyces sp. H34-S4]MCY0934531.1 hypothetical protein [Streptomyces sp. H34-S4]